MVDLDELRREIVLAVSQSKSPREFLRDRRLKELYDQIKSLPPVERGPFGKQINELKQAVEQAIAVRLEELEKVDLKSIDVTAPMDVNSPKPELLPSEQGTIHPLSAEIERISEIFNRMGFVTEESREIDDQFHMFESLNFPKGHPARDDYDTFMTEETDSNYKELQEHIIKSLEFTRGELEELEKANSQINELIKTLEKKIDYVNKVLSKANNMNKGTIVLLNQITTISKMRLYDPKNNNSVLKDIVLSSETMDKIDEQLKLII